MLDLDSDLLDVLGILFGDCTFFLGLVFLLTFFRLGGPLVTSSKMASCDVFLMDFRWGHLVTSEKSGRQVGLKHLGARTQSRWILALFLAKLVATSW